jgi:hypothetical protein
MPSKDAIFDILDEWGDTGNYEEAYQQIQREYRIYMPSRSRPTSRPKPKRKLSAWNKFVKANSKKPRFRLRSGSPNLKKLGVAFRKTPAGKKK